MIKYKEGSTNVIADALSNRYVFITSVQAKMLGFELLKINMLMMSIFGPL